jgi:hypothetical protein
MSAPITFVIPGGWEDGSTRGARAAAQSSHVRIKAPVTVTARRGAGDSNIRTQAVPGEDIVIDAELCVVTEGTSVQPDVSLTAANRRRGAQLPLLRNRFANSRC